MSKKTQQLLLDEHLYRDIAMAVTAAMKSTFGIDVTTDNFELGKGMVSLVGDVSGIIGLEQSQLDGTMTLSLTDETVRSILPRVIGQNASVTHEMTVDAVGELTNMIFGQIKTELNNRGHNIKLGIPSVVTGRGHFISQFHRGSYMIIPFYIEGNLFQVHITAIC